MNDAKILWPGWETVRLIGRGSFGAVYENTEDCLRMMNQRKRRRTTAFPEAFKMDELIMFKYF